MQTVYHLRLRRSLVVILGLIFLLIFLELFLRALGFVYLLKQDFKNLQSFGKKQDYVILALGESTTQGTDSSPWPSLLEDILNKKNIGHYF